MDNYHTTQNEQPVIYWQPSDMLEIVLNDPEDFLKIRETLTRIGIRGSNSNRLYQSCHILHKRAKYYIVHFKEMFLLDGGGANLTLTDIARRNTIAILLSDWGLLDIVDRQKAAPVAGLDNIQIISHSQKKNWELISKYQIGKYKKRSTNNDR